MKKSKKIALGCLGFALILSIGLVLFAGDTVRDLWSVARELIFKDPKRTYTGSSRDNLKAMHTGMMLYHESEGQFPNASGWMDAIKPFVQTNDLTQEEAMKKFVRVEGAFGYGMNDLASAKYKGDIKKETVLIFESEDTKLNAHGSPPQNALGIQIDGGLTKP